MDEQRVDFFIDVLGPLGQQFKRIRKVRKMTQKEVAAKMGVSDVSISQYERGQRNLTLEMMNKFANALNCQVTIQLVPVEHL